MIQLGSMGKMHLVVFLLVALPVASTRRVRKDFSVDSTKIDSRPRVNKYIMDIYQRVKRNDDGTMNVEVRKQTTKVDEIFGYQTMKGGESWGVNIAGFAFNTSDLRRSDTVMAAEFVLTARRGFPSQPVNVTMILVRRESKGQTTFESLGWQVIHWGPHTRLPFDVRQAVEYWRAAQQARGELLVRVKKMGASAPSLRAGLTHTQSAFRRGPTNGPFLVVYLKHSRENETSPALLELLKKQTVLLPSKLPETEDTKFVSRKLSPYRAKGGPRAGSTLVPSCQKSSMSVVLTRIFSWVLNPNTPVTIGLCYGLCYPPLSSSLMPSNHAILIAALLKKRGIREPNRPHCVPLELTGMTVVFLDEETHTVKVQVWDKMVVKKCGCR